MELFGLLESTQMDIYKQWEGLSEKPEIIKKPLLHLSFDDGLSACYDTIAPILLRKGVPATFFLNPAFIDNKALMFRYKISLCLNALDTVIDKLGKEELITAPKTIERLEEISNLRNIQRKMEEDDDDENDKLKISDENIDLGSLDIHVLGNQSVKLEPNLLLNDIEVLA
jgi:hypothetical protein